MRVGGQRHAPVALPPERPGTHCIGGWVGPRAGLDGCGKSRLHRGGGFFLETYALYFMLYTLPRRQNVTLY